MANVLVILQQRDGKLHRMSREAIHGAQKLAEQVGGKAEAVLLGQGLDGLAAEVAGRDLAAVHVLDDARLAAYTPGGYVGALEALVAATSPAWIVAPHTYQSVDFVPRLAQAIGAAYVPDVTGFESGGDGLVFRRPVLGGKLTARARVRGDGAAVVTLQAGSFDADGAAAGTAEVKPFAVPADVAADREILGVEQVGGDQIDLTKADTIVAVGRGIGGAEKMAPVEELARVLGAEIGASRPVIDSGWLPRDRQIGSSGQTVAPKLYLAFGISGAIQHLVGMKGSSVVVAVNKDPGAPIFNIANYGIVGDLHEIVPAITAAVKEAKGV